MSNSSLISYTKLSPNHSGRRTHTIDRITPHCIVGQLGVESIGQCFIGRSRRASCNYGIGYDGKIALIVDEGYRSWCSSSNDNDQRAVTIECASDKTAPYAFNPIVYDRLVDLCVDVCKRNGKNKLFWLGDKAKSLNYNPSKNEMVLTVHRWFANKSCPGDWMFSRMGQLANDVTARLTHDNGNAKGQDEKMEKFYHTYKDIPAPYQPTIHKLMVSGYLKGKGAGVLDVNETFCRIFTILDRMGKL